MKMRDYNFVGNGQNLPWPKFVFSIPIQPEDEICSILEIYNLSYVSMDGKNIGICGYLKINRFFHKSVPTLLMNTRALLRFQDFNWPSKKCIYL